MTMETTTKISDDVPYEVVGTLIDGGELRRYTFYDGSAHSAIFADGCIKEAVPIEKEDKLIAWWESQQHEEVSK